MKSDTDPPPTQIKASELAEYLGLRRFHVLLLATAFMFSVVQGSVAGGMPYLLDAIKYEFHVDDSSASAATSGLVAGSILGVFVGGRMSDVIGRCRAIVVCLVSSLFLGLAHVLIPRGVYSGYLILITLRVLLGVPYGVILSVQTPLILEYFPDYARGSAAAIASLGWNVGVLYTLVYTHPYDVNAPWRVCCACGPIGPIVVALAMLSLIPESPRWLLTQGEAKPAQESLNVIFASEPIYGSAVVGQAPYVDATDFRSSGTQDLERHSTFKVVSLLFSPGLCWTTVISMLMYLLLAGPCNVIWTWGPLILEKIMDSKPPREIFRVSELAGIFGVLTTVVFIDRISRRALVAMAFGMITLCMLVLVLSEHFKDDSVLIAWILRQFFDNVLWCVVCIYVSEAFPTVLRGTASGLVLLSGRFASVVLPLLAGIWIRSSVDTVLVATTIMFFIAAVLALAIPKETSALPMEDALSADNAAYVPFASSSKGHPQSLA